MHRMRGPGVVVLINSDAAGASELVSQLLKVVLGLPLGDHKEITLDPKLYDSYSEVTT
ncbi:MAG TPA: hypothetical protein VFB14_23885 [Bryobacteraceae bacterium]|nr:hypothetical protein [Bryobacteraceae bacterium]